MKKTPFDKSLRSDRTYFLGDLPARCNANATARFGAFLLGWAHQVCGKPVADVTQCEIYPGLQWVQQPGTPRSEEKPKPVGSQRC